MGAKIRRRKTKRRRQQYYHVTRTTFLRTDNLTTFTGNSFSKDLPTIVLLASAARDIPLNELFPLECKINAVKIPINKKPLVRY